MLSIVTLISIAISSIIDIINYIVFRKENIKTQKKFTKRIDGLKASMYRGLISIGTLPNKAYISICSIVKTIYRMKITKQHLLEWTTAEEAEKKDKKDLKSMYKNMLPNVILGVLGIVLIEFFKIDILSQVLILIISLGWIFTPFIMWYISRDKEEKRQVDRLNKEEKEYVKNIAQSTWGYFAEYMNKENNFLPPDNFQESRKEKIVSRTSSTNIGLGILTIISAYDLKFISLEKAITSIENTMGTIENLDKWNGHLYNWYNTKTLKPLIPRYISTVDSGNFIRIYVYS